MAKGYNKWTGKLDYEYWSDEFLKAGTDKTKAQNVITNMMKTTTKGPGGVSNNDQKQVVKLLDKYIKLFGEDGIERVYNTWDPSKNHINELELDDAIAYWQSLAKNPQIQYSGASVPAGPSGFPAQSVNTPRDYNHVPAYNYVSAEPVVTNPYLDTKPNSTGSGGGVTPEQITQIVDQVISNYYDNHKYVAPEPEPVMSAQEVADLLKIDYNLDNISKDYANATNKYYDDLLAEHSANTNQMVRNSYQYLNQLTDAYANSYANAAPTAAGKAARAANMLSMQLNAANTVSDSVNGMDQTARLLEKERTKELDSGALLAEQYYNTLGTQLSTAAANKNYADVQNYVAEKKALSDVYAADRAYASGLANAAAAKYAGLANASATSAASSGNSNLLSQLYSLYLQVSGGNKTTAANKFASDVLGV